MIAEGYFRKAEQLFITNNDFHGIAVAENNIGLVKFRQQKNARIAKEEINARIKAEKDLEKLNLELKENNTGKDRFISILSHDLRSLFNALMGFTDLLVEETADKNIPEIRHYSKMVQQISRGTFQMLENLLTWSRHLAPIMKKATAWGCCCAVIWSKKQGVPSGLNRLPKKAAYLRLPFLQ